MAPTTKSKAIATPSGKTPQATDDLFTAALPGLSEDEVNVVYLNVMANDRDGVTKTLYSLNNSISTGHKLNGANPVIASDSKPAYDENKPAASSGKQTQRLAAGQNTTVTVNYGVSDGIATTAASVNFTIDGKSDAPEVRRTIRSTTNKAATGFTINLLQCATDADSSDTLSVANLTEVSGNDAGGVRVSGNNLVVDPATYNYLAAGESITLIYTYDVFDGTGYTPTFATITIDSKHKEYSDKPIGENKRGEARVDVVVPFKLDNANGLTRNMSAGGIFFDVDANYTLGSEISFVIEAETLNEKMLVKCKGSIVRTEKHGQKISAAAKITESVTEAVK